MERKEEFGVKFWGVGGREVQVPIASFWFGGSVGRRVRRDVAGSMGCLWTYCGDVSRWWCMDEKPTYNMWVIR
jgi:hypothetical protein